MRDCRTITTNLSDNLIFAEPNSIRTNMNLKRKHQEKNVMTTEKWKEIKELNTNQIDELNQNITELENSN